MNELFKIYVQKQFSKFGYHISQNEKNVLKNDAFNEQKRLLSKIDVKVIFDIGAADGSSSIHYNYLFPNATIYAFEPLPQSFNLLAKTTNENKLIIPLNYAVSDKIEEVDFHVTALDDSSSLLQPSVTGSSFDRHHRLNKKIKVQTTTLDSIVKAYKINHIDLLKIDAQGAENLIFKGAENLLNNLEIELIYCEVSFITLYKGSALFHEICSLLEKKRYKLFNVFNIEHNQKGQIAWGDALFVKENFSI